jgi:hypothetical protein
MKRRLTSLMQEKSACPPKAQKRELLISATSRERTLSTHE